MLLLVKNCLNSQAPTTGTIYLCHPELA